MRRLIREHNLDMNVFSGSGKAGRVLKEDVLKHLGLVDSPVKKSEEATKTKQQAFTLSVRCFIPLFIYSLAL